jgi:tRNA-binding EMAP/Myf-like protein
MSECIVEVCEISDVQPHPNADKLELAYIKGWQCVVGKGQFKAGDRVVYFPPDTTLPVKVSDRLGVTQYLHNGRIKGIRLRGEPSFGLVVAVPDPTMGLGVNVAEYYHAEKYEPPAIAVDGGMSTAKAMRPAKTWIGRLIQKYTWKWRVARTGNLPAHPKFPKYTEVENLRHYNTVLEPGEEVVVTEKIHGTSSRVAVIDGVEMAGSHNFRKLRPKPIGENWWGCVKVALGFYEPYGPELKLSTYWYPFTLPTVRNMLHDLSAHGDDVILYGEIYGKVQELKYGHPNELQDSLKDSLNKPL